MADDLPPGFTLDKPDRRPAAKALAKSVGLPEGFTVDQPEAIAPAGTNHDGDTFKLTDGRNARLYGADAFELGQTGRDRAGNPVQLGRQAQAALEPFAQPGSVATPTGAQTYGRPVASLTADGRDAAGAIIDQGLAIAVPEYLRNDPARLATYMEGERLARLNRRGAWSTSFEQPASYRHGTPDPWAAPTPGKPGERTAVFWDDPLPAQGLRPEIAEGYQAIWQDRSSKPDDLLAYAKANGFSIDPATTRKAYAERDKGRKAGTNVTYTSPPRVLTDLGDGRLGATMRGIGDPLNVLDEAGALVDTFGGTAGRENVFTSDRRFGDIYANNLDQNRSILANDEAAHPYWRVGGQLVSGLAIPGASVEGVGFNAARTALRNRTSRFVADAVARKAIRNRLVTAGALEGTAIGAGGGETPLERVTGGAIGGVTGGLVGLASGTLGLRAVDKARGLLGASRARRAALASAGVEPPVAPVAREAGASAESVVPVQPTAGSRSPIDVADRSAAVEEAQDRAMMREVRDAMRRQDAATPLNDNAGPETVEEAARRRWMEADDAYEAHAVAGTDTRPGTAARRAWDAEGERLWQMKADAEAAYRNPPVTPNTTGRGEAGDGLTIHQDGFGYQNSGNLFTYREGDKALHGVARVEGDTLTLDLNGSGANDSGPAFMRRALRALGERFPEAQKVGGFRTSGARAEAADMAIPFQRMAADDPARPIDRIDVNARPRPMMDDSTAMERMAAADRVRPSDMLPLPANTVGSMEEAERIAAGRVVPVRAPNEAAELATRAIPSPRDATRTLPKRGPLDLVTWLRTQGGIRAQGGELERYGITNAPRKGMDHAQGENRFGPLISNEGMTYDDAAERAWEAGFFADLNERPTAWEFLEALNQTHTGRSRAFRPDDLEEIDRFEAARSQRYDVEAARQEGRPLVNDRGQPVGPDDLDANAPPVSAYEEWGENAPQLAGNLRLDKLDSPQAIGRALAETHRRVGGFDAATRGRITHAETEALAGELGMTADDLLARRKGQAFNAEEALAARQILARSATDLVNLARRVDRTDTPGDELEAAFKQAWLRHVAIQEQVAGATAEAGRALSAFRMAADARLAGGRVLPTLGDIAGGTARLKDAASLIVENGSSPAALNQATAKALKPRFRDMLTELYYNFLLSKPSTHVVNMLSNTLTALGQIPEHAVAAGIGAARKAFPSQAETDRVLFSELGARTVGLIQGTKEGMRQAARTFITGEPADAVKKVEQATQRAIPGKVGSVLRTPTRALAAEDELFKAMARRMELTGLAVRQARKEGLKGRAAKDRAAYLVQNPTDAMLARSFEYGRYLTFQSPLGQFGQLVSRGTETLPALKLIIPFVRTPLNLLKFAIERSPGAPLLKEWRKDMTVGGARRDLALAKVLVGTGAGVTVFQMAQAGQITGGGPADPAAKRLLEANGWQPYSFKVGDRYYSYSRLDPYSTTLGVAADLVDLQSHMTDKQRDHTAKLVTASILHNLGNKTWLSGLSSALEAINDPDRYLDSFLSRTAAGVTTPGALAQIAASNDPYLREARGPLDRIRSRIPGMASDLPVRRDMFGKPVMASTGVGPDFLSPIYTSTDRNDPTVRALLSAGVSIGRPLRKVGDRELTPAEYSEYSRLIGEGSKRQLDGLVRDPSWRRLDSEGKQDAVDKLMRGVRADARTTLFGGGAKARGRAPAPAGLSDLPPGFTLDR